MAQGYGANSSAHHDYLQLFVHALGCMVYRSEIALAILSAMAEDRILRPRAALVCADNVRYVNSIGFLGYASKRKFDELLKKNESLKQRWEPEVRQHDDRLFREGIGILPDNVLIEILDSLQTDDSYLSSESRQLRAFTYFFSQVGNQYLDSMLSVKVVDFKSALNQLLAFLGGNFFVYPEHQSGNDLKLCMYPRLNDDRDGDGKLESALKYRAFEEQLDCLVREVRRTHNDYRLAAKNYLYV